jgi:hypothetical protein
MMGSVIMNQIHLENYQVAIQHVASHVVFSYIKLVS